MRVIRIDKFIKEESQINWLIEGLLPDVGWTLFYGKRGEGKTTFAMQLCDALQRGVSFLGRKTVQTDIMYIQADSIPDEWRQMLSRITPRGSNGYTCVEVPSRCLGTPQYVDSIHSWIDKFKPGFIVFDSLYNLTAWPINTEAILNPVNIIKDIVGHTPWMMIHHPPQHETRAAGHHSLGGNCSNEWALLKTKLKIEKGRLVKDKEVLLSRDENGLWCKYDEDNEESSAIIDTLMSRRVK
jgi:AAA domain